MNLIEEFANLLIGGLTLPPELIFVARCVSVMIAIDIMCCLLGIITGLKRVSS